MAENYVAGCKACPACKRKEVTFIPAATKNLDPPGIAVVSIKIKTNGSMAGTGKKDLEF